MTVETRGSWTVDHGIARRWQREKLDAAFVAEWPGGVDSGYTPLNDQEARPETPFPYCVYEKGITRVVERHSGRDILTERAIYIVPITFTIHAKETVSRSAKQVAEDFAKLVKTAYDVGTDLLDIRPDCHLETYDSSDFDTSTGDGEHAWQLEFELLIDGTLNTLAAR